MIEQDSDELVGTISDFPVGNDIRDPHTRLAEVRREPCIHAGPIFDLPHLSTRPTYHALTHEDVTRALADPTTFNSSCHAEMMGIVMGHTLLEMDGEEHRLHRELVSRAFWQKTLARWETALVAPVVESLVNRFQPRGRADLIPEFTVQFPVRVAGGFLGLPAQDLKRFVTWSLELISVGADWDRGMAASAALSEYFLALIADRRTSPRDDLISELVTTEVEGRTLSDDEIVAYLRLLLPAGVETTYRASGNLLFALLTHPEQLDAVRADHSLIPAAIEEALRWEPPLLQTARMVIRDTEIGGVEVKAGSLLSVWVGAANRDETRFENPDRFDIFRPSKQHRSFGFGAHMCLGMHLARMEMRVALDVLLTRLPDIRLDPDAEVPFVHGLMFRSPSALPVIFG